MSTMKAVQVPHAGDAFELVERPLPEPEVCQVRIKVQACGVCHSDSTVKEGGVYPITYPRIPGHEVIGVIDAVGKGVRPWSVGQCVGVGWHGGHDFVCSACRRGILSTARTLRSPEFPTMAGTLSTWWLRNRRDREKRSTARRSGAP